MADILDGLSDLDDDEFSELLEEDNALLGEVIDLSPVDLDGYEMSASEAHEITDAIRSAATATFVLLAEAHRHKAHQALGYSTWAEYVRQEFDMTSQRSYQLLALSSVANEIEGALPEGSHVKLTEKQARDIKRELPKITEQIREETQGLDPEEASQRAVEIVDHHREAIKSQRKEDLKAVEAKENALAAAEEDGYRAGLEAAADAFLEDSDGRGHSQGFSAGGEDGYEEGDRREGAERSSAPTLGPEAAMFIYNFFNALSSVTSLPDPEEFLSLVPQERAAEINNQLLEASSWLNRFQTLWNERYYS